VLQETEIQAAGPNRRRPYVFSPSIAIGSLAVLDTFAIVASGLISYRWVVGWHPGSLDYYLLATTFVAVATLGLVHFGRLYALDALMHPFAYVDRIILALGSALLLLLATLYSLHAADDFSYEWATAFAGGSIGGVVGCRIVIQRILKQLSDHDVIKRNIAIVGTGRQARALIAQLRDNPPDFTSFVGVFEDAAPGERAVEGAHVLGGLQDLSNSVRRNLIDDVIIALPWSEDDKVASLVEELSVFPVSIHLAADLVGFRLGLARIPGFSEGAHGLFANSPILELSRRPLSGWGIVAKSALDYVLGTALLIALLPVFALVAAAVKLDSAGPVFYRQKRLGFNNEEFDIYKFRSMRIETGDTARTVQATRDDPRVTRVGRFIRRTSIDELPQILNVLNGTMSLVGPRPHAMDHNEEYSKRIRGYFARHRVKPGITGWAQVNGLRGETPQLRLMEARVRYDVYYTENWSILFDLRILLWTAVSVLFGRNAY
jgi:Undecaprenyl-phosphate glucose phosphotransferase